LSETLVTICKTTWGNELAPVFNGESWSVNQSDKRYSSAEMRILRPVPGFTLVDQKKNTDRLYVYRFNCGT
jgi:hypothetical protein